MIGLLVFRSFFFRSPPQGVMVVSGMLCISRPTFGGINDAPIGDIISFDESDTRLCASSTVFVAVISADVAPSEDNAFSGALIEVPDKILT